MQAAEEDKAKGNAEFQAGNLQSAIKSYEQALQKIGVRMLSGPDLPHDESAAAAIMEAGPELAARCKACRVPTQLNLALCCLRLEPCEAGRALDLCESVLDEEPENPKAIYRKSKALAELDLLDEAEWELTRACKLMPKDAGVRQDLQKLRQRMREMAAAEKRTFKRVFAKGAGFASDGRQTQAPATSASPSTDPRIGHPYKPIKASDENPFATSTSPAEEATGLQNSGRLEEAIWALEAALEHSQRDGDASARCRHLLELGRFYMDLNIGSLALCCLDEAQGSEEKLTQQHASLLSAICLLNEADSDTEKEVSEALCAWLAVALPSSSAEPADLGEQLGHWLKMDGPRADIAVAQGVLHLAGGRLDDALEDFARVLRAPDDERGFFGNERRQATKWNMLGAVLANRGRHSEALNAYEWALRLQPHYPRALTNQGVSLQAASQPTKAAASFAKAIAIVPPSFSQELWPMLEKAAESSEHAEHVSLAEAAAERNFTKVQALLATEMAPLAADRCEQDLEEVLNRLGLVAKA